MNDIPSIVSQQNILPDQIEIKEAEQNTIQQVVQNRLKRSRELSGNEPLSPLKKKKKKEFPEIHFTNGETFKIYPCFQQLLSTHCPYFSHNKNLNFEHFKIIFDFIFKYFMANSNFDHAFYFPNEKEKQYVHQLFNKITQLTVFDPFSYACQFAALYSFAKADQPIKPDEELLRTLWDLRPVAEPIVRVRNMTRYFGPEMKVNNEVIQEVLETASDLGCYIFIGSYIFNWFFDNHHRLESVDRGIFEESLILLKPIQIYASLTGFEIELRRYFGGLLLFAEGEEQFLEIFNKLKNAEVKSMEAPLNSNAFALNGSFAMANPERFFDYMAQLPFEDLQIEIMKSWLVHFAWD